MSTVDIALLLIILFGAFMGYREGFLLELFSLVAIILGVLGGFKLMGEAMVWLDSEFEINKTFLPYLAFLLVFIVILIGVRLIGRVLKAAIDRSFLGTIDQAAGAGLGVVKMAFMISVALWILDAFDFDLPDRWTANSWLLPRLESFAPQVTIWLGEFIPFFRDVFT